VATDGWSKMTGHDVVDLARKFEDYGVEAVIYTDIGRDGMLTGVNIEATVRLARALRIPVIASGGIAELRDVDALCAVEDEGIMGAITGRAIYEGTLDFAAAQARADELERRRANELLPQGQPMLAKRIIPCLDVKAGRVVKGVNFVEPARRRRPGRDRPPLRRAGRRRDHLPRHHRELDDRDIILHVVEQVAEQVFIPLTVGGGVRVVEDVRRLLNAGADKVSMNTAAVQTRSWSSRPRARSAASASWWRSTPSRPRPASWEVFTHGGRKGTGLDAIEWARKVERWGPARSCSPAWTATAPRAASTSR
jgi:imidazole glycerol phosphate synthase subunit HisF